MIINQFTIDVSFEMAMRGDTRADVLENLLRERLRSAVKEFAAEREMFVDGFKCDLQRVREVRQA